MSDKLVDFYCNQKFKWLTLDLEKKLTYSCCAATPEKINLAWLKNNPGNIFNTDLLKLERQNMLENIPVKSCAKACWIPESQGLTSRRIQHSSMEKTHTDVVSKPDTLNIVLGSTCNLTCSYCCKQYSTAWLHDIKNNGVYSKSTRFKIEPIDRVILKLSQTEIAQTKDFETLLKEIKLFRNPRKIDIQGGEPFLYNNLDKLIENIPDTGEIIIWSGLGVDSTRLKTQINKIKHIPNLKIFVSAENINKFYEFNRYGNTYQKFEQNLKIINDCGVKINFNSVISNLTAFGLVEFADRYHDIFINYDFCHDPDYLGIRVLDNHSKEKLIKSIQNSSIAVKDSIVQELMINPTTEQRQQCSVFVNEFARRRNLGLDIFPDSMLQWLNYVV